MAHYRRYYIPDTFVFLTCVTIQRAPVLSGAADLALFWQTLGQVKAARPFGLFAYAHMPDHFHWLIRCDQPGGSFSQIVQSVKWNFTRAYKQAHRLPPPVHLWQPRFWDHVIRDERDLQTHMDYIHWNPVKHGYTSDPADWEQSSFRFWAERGVYGSGWGQGAEPPSIHSMMVSE